MIGGVRSWLLRVRRHAADRVLRTQGTAMHPDPPLEGKAPVLIVGVGPTQVAGYYAEILRAEGLTTADQIPGSELDPSALAGRRVVLVADAALDDGAPELLRGYVEAGGCLVVVRPSPQLGPLLGLEPLPGSVDDGYLRVVGDAPATSGIVQLPLQIHGVTDRWSLVDAVEVASLLLRDRTPTGCPAVTERAVGQRGGRAIAFAYDIAKSIVLTRQGNPDWAGQNRDGDLLIRSSEMFFGGSLDDPQPDWVDRSLFGVPQADEQQRLLVNLLVAATAGAARPLPRFWYLPHGHRAVVVMTGDDHGTGGTVARFDRYRSMDRPGAVEDDWECVRATSYVFPRTKIPWHKLVAYNRRGFEVGVHVNTLSRNWTPDELRGFYAKQISWFRNRLSFAGPPVTHRTHCVTWSDYDTQVRVELEHGIRLDTNYYLYPPRWVRGGSGYFTGSGLPMRFSDAAGDPIDVYQAVTQITDEAEQELPRAFDELIDGALGPEEFVTVVTVNAHTDFAESGVSDAVVSASQDRGVPIVSARQMLTWLDARNSSWVELGDLRDGCLRFTVHAHPAARGLQLLVPAEVAAGAVPVAVRRDGQPIPLEVDTFKGLPHLRLAAVDGVYEVDYESPSVPSPTPLHRATSSRGSSAQGELVPLALTDGELHRLTARPVGSGELVLAPALHADASGEEVPSGWQAAGRLTSLGDRTVIANGSLSSIKEIRPVAVEAAAAFSAGGKQRLGFSAPTGESAVFEVALDGTLEAVVWHSGRRVSVPIPGSWVEATHRYRIDVEPSGTIRFWIDQSDVALIDATLPERVTVVAESEGGDSSGLAVHWLSALPHARQGMYTSPVLDVVRPGRSARLRWTAVYQQGTTIRAEARRGEAASPDGEWTPWALVGASNHPVEGSGRYLQYRLTLAAATSYKTPSVRSVELVLGA